VAIKFTVQAVCIDINLGSREGDNFTPRLRPLLSMLYTPGLSKNPDRNARARTILTERFLLFMSYSHADLKISVLSSQSWAE
jgi:hypothetical protein